MSATPGDIRRSNERAVVDRLLRGRAASRAALAQELGMSAPTAGKVIGELIGRGVIEEMEEGEGEEGEAGRGEGGKAGRRDTASRHHGSTMGRPGRLLRLESRTPRLVLVQLGVRRTRLLAAALGGGRDDARRWAASFATPRSVGAWRRAMAEVSLQLSFPGAGPAVGAWAVVASVPGLVDEAAGRVVYSPNLHWTEGVDLAGALQSVWPAPVALVQEIRALALGHHVATAAVDPGDDDFLLADFGDGVGGAAVVRGRLLDAALPMTGELGHTPVAGNRRRCGCGNVGCVETLVSRAGLLASFAASRRKPRGGARWADLRERVAERGVEPWLGEALDEAGRHVAAALNVLGLRKVVVTGSVAELGDAAVARLGEAVRGAALWARFGGVECEAAPRRRALGLVAAGLQRVVAPADERDRAMVRAIGKTV